MIQDLNPFFDLGVAQDVPEVARPQPGSRNPVHRWSAIPTLPLYMPALSVDDLG